MNVDASDRPSSPVSPSVVEDRWGNLWRRYPDVGYVRLITQSRRMESAARDLTALRERTGGTLTAWKPTDEPA